MKYKYLILTSCLFSLIIAGCSSNKEITKEKVETKKVETPVIPPKKVLSFDLREKEHYKLARIKAVDKISFDYDKKGNLVKGGKISSVSYDPEGLVSKTIIFGKKDFPEDLYSYSYDKNGRRIETKLLTPSGEPKKIFTYEYDKSGNKIKSVRYDLYNKIEKYYLYKYDDDGNLIEENWFDKSGKPEYQIVYKYNREGRKTESFTYDGSKSLISRFLYKYDENGNVVEETKFGDKNKPVGIIQYVYFYY